MSEEPISPTPIQMSLWVDFPVSRSPMPATGEEPTTPDISGRKCLELSGNSGPLGLLEKMLLGSQNWAWTKYSLTWKASGHLGGDGSVYGQSGENWWTVEPNVGRVAHGIPNRVSQLRALGNAIIPQIAKEIGNAIKGTY